MSDEVQGAALHLGIAEQGKLFALKGDHGEALRHYREALRMAMSQGSPEVFFRHYTQCVLESLEHTGAWGEILAFCERAEAHYADNPPQHELARLDLASHRERRGVVLAKAGRTDEARAALEAAVAGAEADWLPVGRKVLQWLQRGLTIDARRIGAEQQRHAWFIVRKDAVDPARAVRLPDGVGPLSP